MDTLVQTACACTQWVCAGNEMTAAAAAAPAAAQAGAAVALHGGIRGQKSCMQASQAISMCNETACVHLQRQTMRLCLHEASDQVQQRADKTLTSHTAIICFSYAYSRLQGSIFIKGSLVNQHYIFSDITTVPAHQLGALIKIFIVEVSLMTPGTRLLPISSL
jgi:hypothetical protein